MGAHGEICRLYAARRGLVSRKPGIVFHQFRDYLNRSLQPVRTCGRGEGPRVFVASRGLKPAAREENTPNTYHARVFSGTAQARLRAPVPHPEYGFFQQAASLSGAAIVCRKGGATCRP